MKYGDIRVGKYYVADYWLPNSSRVLGKVWGGVLYVHDKILISPGVWGNLMISVRNLHSCQWEHPFDVKLFVNSDMDELPWISHEFLGNTNLLPVQHQGLGSPLTVVQPTTLPPPQNPDYPLIPYNPPSLIPYSPPSSQCGYSKPVVNSNPIYTVVSLGPKKVCECGIDKIGGGIHSSWCPKG